MRAISLFATAMLLTFAVPVASAQEGGVPCDANASPDDVRLICRGSGGACGFFLEDPPPGYFSGYYEGCVSVAVDLAVVLVALLSDGYALEWTMCKVQSPDHSCGTHPLADLFSG